MFSNKSDNFKIKEESIDKKSEINNEIALTKCGEVIFKDEILLFTCSFCIDKFVNVKSFISHITQKHLRKDLYETLLKKTLYAEFHENQQFPNNSIKTEDNNFERDLKSFKFKTNDDEKILQINENVLEIQHDLKTELKVDGYGNKNFENQNEKSNKNQNSKNFDLDCAKELNYFSCKVCNKRFRRSYHCKRHEQSVHGSKNNKKQYKYKIEGENTAVSDIKRFICETCGKEFKTHYHLKEHQNIHSGVRPYTCNLCGHSFAKKRVLVYHMRCHLKDRPYKCGKCEKSFIERRKLRLHEMIHTNSFPFKCNFCDKCFRSRYMLKLHIKRHENYMYKCDNCDKSFFDQISLKQHSVLHNDEKPFACEQCCSRFPRKAALQLHMHLHSDKKKYKCKICAKEFHQYNGIYKHMKSHGIKYSSAYEKGECDGRFEESKKKNEAKS